MTAGVAWTACVSHDPSSPHAEAIAGTYAATVAIAITNVIETRYDTAAATLVLRDSMYRGRFHGFYRFADGDSGRVAGTLRPGDIVLLSDFGPPPKQIAGVAYLQQLYPWCDFPRLGSGGLSGELRGDTLTLLGVGALPCFYDEGAGPVERHTEFELVVTAVRQ